MTTDTRHGFHSNLPLPSAAPEELSDPEWSRLHHAYGRAVDTPAHLAALLDGDEASRQAAVLHLWSAVLHQGTPWSATAPAAVRVARVLGDVRISALPELRATLLRFLAEVGSVVPNSGLARDAIEDMAVGATDPPDDADEEQAFFEDVDRANGYLARSLLACVRVAPELLAGVRAQLDDDDERVRAAASHAAARLVDAASEGAAADIVSSLYERARAATSADERCALTLALGELHASVRDFLDDPSPAVRTCAALAPALDADERATRVLIAALEDAAHLDGWFRDKPPQMAMQPRFPVVRALVRRVADFEALAAGAVALVGVTNLPCVDFDWGPLLAAAFPLGDGIVRTDGQRRYLRALVDHGALWNPRMGNPRRWFQKAGLPYDRTECERRVRTA